MPPTATVSSFPVEVLTEIFRVYLNSEPERMKFPPMSANFLDAGVQLDPSCPKIPIYTQVCSRWRAIALDCPSLWSSLAVDWTGEDDVRKLEFCKLWLGRSGNQPLTVAMNLEDPNIGEGWHLSRRERELLSNTTIGILYLIIGYAHRLRSLHLRVHLPALATELANVPRNDVQFHSLEVLSINNAEGVLLDQHRDELDASSLWPDFFDCPRLRVMSIGSTGMLTTFDDPLTAPIPWKMLVRLDCNQQLSFEDIFQVFQMCPNLNTAAIRIMRIDQHSPFNPIRTTVLLRSFTLKSVPSVAAKILLYLVLPMLETFRFIFDDGHDQTNPLSSFTDLFLRSSSPLTSFSFEGITSRSDDAGFALLFKAIPGLRNLKLEQVGYEPMARLSSFWGKRFWVGKAGLRKLSGRKVLPLLESLTLNCTSRMDEALLLGLVRGRMMRVEDGRVPLKSLNVRMPKSIHGATKREFKSAGIRVNTHETEDRLLYTLSRN